MLTKAGAPSASNSVSQTTREPTARRPAYLVIAMIALWLVGMTTAAEGFAAMEIVRNPFSSAFGTLSGDVAEDAIKKALVEGIQSISRVALPVGLAQLILGALLVGVASKILFARRASANFALQTILANIAVVAVGYALWQPVRSRIVDAVITSGIEQRPPNITPADFDRLVRIKTWWTFRFRLGLQLAVLGLGALAVSRRGARDVLSRPEEPSAHEER